MAHIGNVTSVHDAWCKLADAIVTSGIKAHDVTFLQSHWCETLKALASMLTDHKTEYTVGSFV